MPRIVLVFKALRLPFISAGILPFLAGFLMPRTPFPPFRFLAGLFCAAAAHLGANLINDYFDSKSGVDWQDHRAYEFFGGSKLIQKKLLTEGFYLRASAVCFAAAGSAAALLSWQMKSLLPAGIFAAVLFFAWGYTAAPLKFVYRCLGEPVIFLLFGPALVMGGYFIRSEVFLARESFFLSVPFGFLVAAVLFANEVPDFFDDAARGKRTWVGLCGQKRAYLVYLLLIAAALLALVFNFAVNNVHGIALLGVLAFIPAVKAALILKSAGKDKHRMILSSRMTIAAYHLAAAFLILGVII